MVVTSKYCAIHITNRTIRFESHGRRFESKIESFLCMNHKQTTVSLQNRMNCELILNRTSLAQQLTKWVSLHATGLVKP